MFLLLIFQKYSSNIDEKYVGDITYIPTNEGWLYLAVVIDIYSRKVVGWSMRYSLHTILVNDALLMAIKRRNPSLEIYIKKTSKWKNIWIYRFFIIDKDYIH